MNIKKLSTIFSIFLFFVNLYAENFTKCYTFDCNSINELKASLQFENLTIANTKKSEIIVEFMADDEALLPEIVQKNSTIIVKNAFSNFTNKSSCDVNILVPEAFASDSIYLETHYGKITINNLNAKKLKIIPGSENHYSNIKTDSLVIGDYDESDVIIDNLNCKMCEISRTVGNITISFAKAPVLDSQIRVKTGNITLSLPEEENFTISANSFNSKFINNFTGVVKKYIRDGIEYTHNKGGAVISLKTHSGDITIMARVER